MEHVGAIDYKASSLFLDSGATRDQENARANLIAHETAHMWFGDLVTMRWFNDVWMKEVFANFMADKVGEVSQANNNFELKFLLDHLPAAYSVDRTTGANPIRQQLANLQDAGTLYGNIIYHKAPIMMRQLERLMGKDAFRDGLREYLAQFKFHNAAWPELITILKQHTTEDLDNWNKVWVNEAARPVIRYQLQQKNGRISRFVIEQVGEHVLQYMLPQFFEIALVYDDRVDEYTVHMDQQQLRLKDLEGQSIPKYIIFNSSGQGYGLFPVDKKMLPFITSSNNPVMRASGYINLYENMLSGNTITPGELLKYYQAILSKETEELNLRLLTTHISDVFWRFLLPTTRRAVAASLQPKLWQAMMNEKSANKKKLLFKAFQSIALTRDAEDTLYHIWKKEQPPLGVKLTEEDYTSLALSLAVRDYPVAGILEEQVKRIRNVDRKNRLKFQMPALSSDVRVRDSFFASLSEEKNREKEAWVVAALEFLHHPLRAATSKKYLQQSLELLEEIQLTGDIFFPAAWLQSTFGYYQGKENADVVRRFLANHPSYNEKLKAKVLQATDLLFRAEKLVERR
jgi:aminopeptidase N